jgi:hypothetical protein
MPNIGTGRIRLLTMRPCVASIWRDCLSMGNFATVSIPTRDDAASRRFAQD